MASLQLPAKYPEHPGVCGTREGYHNMNCLNDDNKDVSSIICATQIQRLYVHVSLTLNYTSRKMTRFCIH